MAPVLDRRYWRSATFYFAHFAGLGILVPYWPVYLQFRGFNAGEISAVMSGFVCSRLVAPYFWGVIADRYVKPLRVVRWTSAAALVAFWVLSLSSGLASAVGLMTLFGLFWSGPLPQVEAITLASRADAGRFYGWIRLWGSLGYIATATLLGAYLEAMTAIVVPRAFVVALALIWIVTLLFDDVVDRKSSANGEPFWSIVQRREVAAVLCVAFLMQVGHGPYYTFFTLYLGNHDYSPTVIGRLWALGVLAEVGMFLVIQRLIGRFGVRRLLLSTTIAAGIRWTLIGFLPAELAWVVLAQLLHACTFGVFHAVTVQMVFRYFHGEHQGQGQALFSSLAYGGGGAVGAILSGHAWTALGGQLTYLGAALISLLALFIGWLGIREPSEALRRAS